MKNDNEISIVAINTKDWHEQLVSTIKDEVLRKALSKCECSNNFSKKLCSIFASISDNCVTISYGKGDGEYKIVFCASFDEYLGHEEQLLERWETFYDSYYTQSELKYQEFG